MEERTGINRGELSKIERGKACPTPAQAVAILTAAGIRIAQAGSR